MAGQVEQIFMHQVCNSHHNFYCNHYTWYGIDKCIAIETRAVHRKKTIAAVEDDTKVLFM